VASIDETQLVRLMAGRELAAELAATASSPAHDAVPRLRAISVSVAGRLRDVDLQLGPGEIHGIGGIVGSGRTTLVEVLAGIVPLSGGRLEVDGAPFRPKHPADAMKVGITLVPEDRARDGVFPDLTVATNTTLPRLRQLARLGVLLARHEERAALPLLTRLDVRPPAPGLRAGALSGGNQQKVLLARAMYSGSRVLLLDEPTRGIDVAAKAEVHALIRQLAQEGMSVVVVSSDFRELVSLAQRVTVLARGRVAGVFEAPLDSHSLLAAATGAAA
jgi:ribose transport system ATP-binding protein